MPRSGFNTKRSHPAVPTGGGKNAPGHQGYEPRVWSSKPALNVVECPHRIDAAPDRSWYAAGGASRFWIRNDPRLEIGGGARYCPESRCLQDSRASF